MKIRAIVILGLIMNLFSISCMKNEEPDFIGLTHDTGMVILFMDAEGNNTLDSGVFKDLKLFYIVDGKQRDANYQNIRLDNPRVIAMKSLELGRLGVQNVLSMPANVLDKSTMTTTLLEWKTGMDTIRTELIRKPGVVKIVNVWWNNDLVWNSEFATEQFENDMGSEHRLVRVIK